MGKSYSNNDSKELFSNSSTSSPAPKIAPFFIAVTKSLVTTLFPLAVFINQKGFENCFIKSALIN